MTAPRWTHWHCCATQGRGPEAGPLRPHLPIATVHQLLKTVFPSANYSIIFSQMWCYIPVSPWGIALLGSVIAVGSLGHIWVRGCLSLAHSMELRRGYLYQICWQWLVPCLGSLLFWTSFTFVFFKTCQWVSCTKISCPLRVFPMLRICDNIYY